MFKVKPVVYISDEIVKYSEFKNFSGLEGFEILSCGSKTIGPHGHAKFNIGPHHIIDNGNKYFIMICYMYDSEGNLVPYEQQLDWVKINRFEKFSRKDLILKRLLESPYDLTSEW